MARASAALTETIRPAGYASPVSASGHARGAAGHGGYCRIGPPEQLGRTSGRVMAFSGDSEAMDKQPRQGQRDGQQQPRPQPGSQKNPHIERPFFFPPGANPPGGPAVVRAVSYRIEVCILPLLQLGRPQSRVPSATSRGCGRRTACSKRLRHLDSQWPMI
jgi:hypothetical protein